MGPDTLSKAQMLPLLMGLVGSTQLISVWWGSPNRAFDLKSPDEMWELDPERVVSYLKLMYHQSGGS